MNRTKVEGLNDGQLGERLRGVQFKGGGKCAMESGRGSLWEVLKKRILRGEMTFSLDPELYRLWRGTLGTQRLWSGKGRKGGDFGSLISMIEGVRGG